MLLIFFFAFPFFSFPIFLLQLLAFYQACFQSKNPQENLKETEILTMD